jgi:hypothetical protein
MISHNLSPGPRTQDPGPKLGPMTYRVPIHGSGPHRYLRPDPWDPIKVAGPTHGAGTLRPPTRPAGSVCSLIILQSKSHNDSLPLSLRSLLSCPWMTTTII